MKTVLNLGYDHTITRQSPYTNSNEYASLEAEFLLNSKCIFKYKNETYEQEATGYSTSLTKDCYTEYKGVSINSEKPSCIAIVGSNYTGEWQACETYMFTQEEISLKWLFPNSKEWVQLSAKESIQLLEKHNGKIPLWLKEKARGFKTIGDGWKVIN